MPITSSTYSLGSIQRDGRRYCIETHTDHLGIARVVEYLANNGADYAAIAASRASALATEIIQEEIRYAVFSAQWNYTMQWSTNTELAAWVRSAYKNAGKETLALIARRILEWIANGRFTDLQLRNAFGLTATQWTTLKGKMQTLADNYNAVQISVGE